MAPLPPDGTARFRFNYVVGSNDHSFQIRSGGSPAAVGTLVDGFLSAISAAMFGLTVTTVEFAASGSSIFLPVTSGIEGNAYGSGTPIVEQVPWFYGFIGRSAAGRKWHLDLFGGVSIGINFRWSPGESGAVDNAIVALQAFGSNLLGIDGSAVTVYTYANAGSNAHYQRKQR